MCPVLLNCRVAKHAAARIFGQHVFAGFSPRSQTLKKNIVVAMERGLKARDYVLLEGVTVQSGNH
jgi:hypothetical protein